MYLTWPSGVEGKPLRFTFSIRYEPDGRFIADAETHAILAPDYGKAHLLFNAWFDANIEGNGRKVVWRDIIDISESKNAKRVPACA